MHARNIKEQSNNILQTTKPNMNRTSVHYVTTKRKFEFNYIPNKYLNKSKTLALVLYKREESISQTQKL